MYFLIIFQIILLLEYVATVTVEIEQGFLKGEQKWSITGETLYNSFKGIPYAAPPTGKWRFMAPQPALSWKGIRNATNHGNVCPQYDTFSKTYIPGSEDCLFLNVYSPNLTPDYLLPVFFFIHGGGYEMGSGNDDSFAPDFFIDLQNVVVVTINYRLDTLGFLCLDSKEIPGNAGMKDQVAALKWVQKNIKHFGGDPGNVTIIGQSAGASSATLHALSPMSKNLFRRVIAMSGVPISEFSVDFNAKRRALALAKSLGFDNSNTTALLEFFQTLPVRQLINTNSSIVAAEEYIDPFVKVYFVPVVEKDFGQERFLGDPPEDCVKKGVANDVDILLGYTTAEGILAINFIKDRMIKNYSRYPDILVPRNIYYKTSSALNFELADKIKEYYMGSEALSMETLPQMVNYVTDIYIYDVVRYAMLLSNFNKGNKLYLYQFSGISERNLLTALGAEYGISGVGHTDDLQYIFQSKSSVHVHKNYTSYKMIKQTCTLLTNFAIYGNPTPDLSLGVNWPEYNMTSQMYLDIGENLTVKKNPVASTMEFWKNMYKKAGLTF